MLVPFVVDADSLTPDPAWPPSVVRSCHHDLLNIWQRMGLLVHDGETFDDSKLARAVQRLPQNLRMLWQAVLAHSPPIPCGNGWNGAVTPSAADKLCSVASLALVDDAHAEVDFGMNEEQDETSITSYDGHHLVVSRLLTANHASVITAAVSVSQQNIQAGESYRDIWISRFRSLASAQSPNLKQISVVDRYAIEQHFRCPQHWLSGLERFLRLLDGDAGGKRYVTLFSGLKTDPASTSAKDLETEMRAVMERLPKSNIKRLVVHMVPNSVFGNLAHDRYVRFGRFVWELGRGLDIFEGPAARHLCQASFKSDVESHLGVEQALVSDAKSPEVCIQR